MMLQFYWLWFTKSILGRGETTNLETFFFFFLIGKKRSNIKRGVKKAIQGIQNLYTHCQNGQKRRKTPS